MERLNLKNYERKENLSVQSYQEEKKVLKAKMRKHNDYLSKTIGEESISKPLDKARTAKARKQLNLAIDLGAVVAPSKKM